MGRRHALTLALAIACIPSVALAQSAKDKKAAGDKVKQAIAKSQAGDHEAALALYQDAYAIIPQPLLLSNIASEYQQIGKHEDALSYFCKYLAADPKGSNASYATTQARTEYVELGGIKDVRDADLCKPIVKPPIFSDAAATAPIPAREEPRTEPARRAFPVLRYAGIGTAFVGAGLVTVGIVFGLQAKKLSDDISSHPLDEPWTGIREEEADGKSYERKQIIFLVAGGIVVGAGVTMFFLGKPKPYTRDYVLAPSVTSDSVGLAAAGRF